MLLLRPWLHVYISTIVHFFMYKKYYPKVVNILLSLPPCQHNSLHNLWPLSTFQAPIRPGDVYVSIYRISYIIRYNETGEEGNPSRMITYTNSSHSPGQPLSYTLTSLSRDTEYTVEISMETRARYSSSVCRYSYGYIYGNYSDPLAFQTNATRK